jgi:predicted TIM-barrel fold metal-dependent hydrolase
MQRRDLLKLAATGATALALRLSPAEPHPNPMIDTHIHLFDPTRPGGVPWPPKEDTAVYKPSTPERYSALTAPFGIVGAIAIEASPLLSDNDWLLNVAASNPVMVGVVGDIIPATPTYLADLDRLHRNPLFLGFRYGNLWGRDLSIDLRKPGFIDGLKALAQAGLVLDSANPDATLNRALLDAANAVSGLTIVIDHLPRAPIPPEPAARDEYWATLRRLAANPRVFVKLSGIPVLANRKLITDPLFYKPRLDALWDIFGEDHVLFGSDFPNSDHTAPFAETFSIVRAYMAGKTAGQREKYFWKNSIAAYRWHPRRPDQPRLEGSSA